MDNYSFVYFAVSYSLDFLKVSLNIASWDIIKKRLCLLTCLLLLRKLQTACMIFKNHNRYELKQEKEREKKSQLFRFSHSLILLRNSIDHSHYFKTDVVKCTWIIHCRPDQKMFAYPHKVIRFLAQLGSLLLVFYFLWSKEKTLFL